ncbi:purine-nucleoside phosphorylase [Fusibacter sp. JL216-2]|uniref:purine-nucleoside phosphorylase n=1 Tax=Fusibacter sp. JL216-2 TaxID=3071453 RepID=UPI003D33D183
MENILVKIKEAKDFLAEKVGFEPEVGLILGSGLGILADEIENPIKIKYEDIPHFPVSTVEGHAGQFVAGDLEGRKVIAMQGRFHFYEGYTMQEVTFPVRVMVALGIKNLMVTNAAGGANEAYIPGDLMLITDHINFAGSNPLIGRNFEELGPRFPDCSEIYDKSINKKVEEIAKDQGIRLQKGVYQMNPGPTYETPAEVRMARILGADAVGMSTVPEAVVARHAGIKVTGISCITNMAAGILDQPLHHGEVVETANMVKKTFIQLVRSIVPVLK